MLFMLIESELFLLVLRFFIGSSLMLGLVLMLDKLNLLQHSIKGYVLKAAVVGSLLLLIPFSSLLSPGVYLPDTRVPEQISFTESSLELALPEGSVVSASVVNSLESQRILDKDVGETGSVFQIISQQMKSWPLILGMIWIAGALSGLVKLYLNYKTAISKLGKRVGVNPGTNIHSIFMKLQEKASLQGKAVKKSLKLSHCKKISSPVSILGNEICLPSWVVDGLPLSKVESILAHEMAHQQKNDPLQIITLQIISKVFFFQPLFEVTLKKIRDAMEFSADQWAASLLGNANELASTLVDCAEKIVYKREFQPGLAIASKEPLLTARIKRLLSKTRDSENKKGKLLKTIVLITVLLSVFSIPHIETLASQSIGTVKVQVTDDKGEINWRNGALVWEGDFRINGIENDMVSIADDGFFELRTRTPNYKIRFEAEGSNIQRTFWIDDESSQFDAGAMNWFHESLVGVMRRTGLDVEDRIQRLVNQGGTEAILNEFKYIQSNYVIHRYSDALVTQVELNESDVLQLLNHLKKVNSDYELNNALTTFFSEVALEEGVQFNAFISTAGMIDSDYELRTMLSAILNMQVVDDQGTVEFINLAGSNISSSYELSLILQGLDKYFADSEYVTNIALTNTGFISSSFQKGQTLSIIVDKGLMNKQNWLEALSQSLSISSDHDKSIFLEAVLEILPQDKEVQQAFQVAKASISSGIERGRL